MKYMLLFVLLIKSMFLISQNTDSVVLPLLMALEFDQTEDPTYESVSKQSLGIKLQSSFLIDNHFEYGRNNGYLTLWDWDDETLPMDVPKHQNGQLVFSNSEKNIFAGALDITDSPDGYTLISS
jgi:hypothetical protein